MTIHYYGLTVAVGYLAGFIIACFLAKKYKIDLEKIYIISVCLIIFGILGARVYHIFNEFSYYLKQPLKIFYIWQGGLAIHGGLITGFFVLFFFAKKYNRAFFSPASGNRKSYLQRQIEKSLDANRHNCSIQIFYRLADIFIPALILGYSIGRWGNFFNQELFGRPTNLPWKIFIDLFHRPLGYESFIYFHPVFLYEFIWGVLILLSLLIYLHWQIAIHCHQLPKPGIVAGIILIFWASGRLLVEFLRIDSVPLIFGMRLPMLMSLGLILIGGYILIDSLIRCE